MAWIKVIEVDKATGKLKELYDQIKTPNGHVDNIMKIHSLRPQTLIGHLSLYKAVMHSKPNALSPRERELIGVYVSSLNGCDYCVQHHRASLARNVKDLDLANGLSQAVIGESSSDELTKREMAFCGYVKKLTKFPEKFNEADLIELRKVGLDDAGILDLNQIVSYFAYANRIVQGLGVTIDEEPLGLHPDENEEGYQHK